MNKLLLITTVAAIMLVEVYASAFAGSHQTLASSAPVAAATRTGAPAASARPAAAAAIHNAPAVAASAPAAAAPAAMAGGRHGGGVHYNSKETLK